MSTLTISLENIVVLVKLPGIPTRLPTGALRQLFLLFSPGLGVGMGGREEHLIGVRMDPATRSLADAGGHTPGVPGLQIQQVHLIKGVVRLAFTLKNHAFAVGAKIALASAPSGKGELACVGQQASFVVRLGRGRTRVCQPDGGADQYGQQDMSQMRHHGNSPVGMMPPRAVGAIVHCGDIVTATLHLTTLVPCFIYSTKSARTPLALRARRRHAQ